MDSSLLVLLVMAMVNLNQKLVDVLPLAAVVVVVVVVVQCLFFVVCIVS